MLTYADRMLTYARYQERDLEFVATAGAETNVAAAAAPGVAVGGLGGWAGMLAQGGATTYADVC